MKHGANRLTASPAIFASCAGRALALSLMVLVALTACQGGGPQSAPPVVEPPDPEQPGPQQPEPEQPTQPDSLPPTPATPVSVLAPVDLYAMTCDQVAAYEIPDTTIRLPRSDAVPPHGLTPTEKQLKWQHMEYYAFIHFGVNTYTNKQWGFGNDNPNLFNPTALDTDQWACEVKRAGMHGIVITAKHHDGFVLWPSAHTDYSVAASDWEDGEGDVIAELAASVKKYKLRLGLYLSPWDRNHSEYAVPAANPGQPPPYITYFRNQITELLTLYGDNVFEMWFDSANGGDGWYGGTRRYEYPRRSGGTVRSLGNRDAYDAYYDWPATESIIYTLAPNAVVWRTSR